MLNFDESVGNLGEKERIPRLCISLHFLYELNEKREDEKGMIDVEIIMEGFCSMSTVHRMLLSHELIDKVVLFLLSAFF